MAERGAARQLPTGRALLGGQIPATPFTLTLSTRPRTGRLISGPLVLEALGGEVLQDTLGACASLGIRWFAWAGDEETAGAIQVPPLVESRGGARGDPHWVCCSGFLSPGARPGGIPLYWANNPESTGELHINSTGVLARPAPSPVVFFVGSSP